jgi:predicted ABC-type ATPase
MVQMKTVVVLAGPNGAGKTTDARVLLPDLLGGAPFVTADIIEKEISEPGEPSRAFPAGRIMLENIRELTARGESLAFEPTLASRTCAPLLRELSAAGYRLVIAYFWLKDADTAIARVSTRVNLDGHDVPPDVVRRR